MKCTYCSTDNEDNFQFCMNCGRPLSQPTVEAAPQETSSTSVGEGVFSQQPIIQQTAQSQPVQQEQHQPPAVPSSQTPSYAAPGAYPSQTAPQYQTASSLSLLNIWGPFAGYGTRRRHTGWLMDNRGEKAEELIEKVNSKLSEREIPSTAIQQQNLVARGVIVENRPYFILKRGLVSMGLYISQFGRDLFISQVSYLKPPISSFRVILLAVMVIFWLYSVYIFPNSIGNAASNFLDSIGGVFLGGQSPQAGGLFRLICLVGPLALINSIALALFIIYSIYKWIAEKDILAGLRVRPNEFNEDDLMALEKTVEQTVRISIDEIGLDPDDLIPVGDLDSTRII